MIEEIIFFTLVIALMPLMFILIKQANDERNLYFDLIKIKSGIYAKQLEDILRRSNIREAKRKTKRRKTKTIKILK